MTGKPCRTWVGAWLMMVMVMWWMHGRGRIGELGPGHCGLGVVYACNGSFKLRVFI